MAADGRILIDTHIDTTGVITGTDEVIKMSRIMATQVNGLSNKVKTAFSRQADALQKNARIYDEQREKVRGLERQLEELRNQNIPTEGYQKNQEEIQKAEAALDKLIQKKKQLEESGKSSVLTSEYKAATKEVDQLEKRLNQLLEKQNKWDVQGAPSGRAYGNLEYEIQNITEKLAKAKEKKDELSSKSTEASGQFQQIERDIENAKQKIEELKAEKEQMETSGTAYISGADTQEAADLQARLNHEVDIANERVRSLETAYNALAAKLEEYGVVINSVASAESEAANEGERLSQAENSVGNQANNARGYVGALEASLNGLRSIPGTLGKLPGALFGGMVSGLKSISRAATNAAGSMANLAGRGITSGLSKVSNNLRKVHKSAESSSKSTGKLGHSLMTIIKYSLGIRSLYALVNKLRRGLIEGMKNLAQYSGETNAALSGLKSSTTQLKNAFATAFAPILTAVAPALIYLINLVTAAATAVSRLAAILTGKNTFVRAKKVQQDYAASLKATGGAAKEAGEEAEGSLASFDKLNVMADESAKSGGGGGGAGDLSPADMFETVPVNDNNLSKALDAAKKKLLELRGLFKKGFFEGAGDLSALDRIKENIQGIGRSLLDIFTDGNVVKAASSLLDTLAYNFGQVEGAFFSIGLTLMENLTGGMETYLDENKDTIKNWLVSMFDITASISTIVGNFMAAFAYILSAFRSEASQSVTASLIEIFMTSFMGVLELGLKFGRDLLDMILTPITENKEEIKKAWEGFMEPVSEVIGTLSKLIKEEWAEIQKVYDEHIHPVFESFRDGITEIVSELVKGYNTYMLPVLNKLADKFTDVWTNSVQPALLNAIGLVGDVADLVKAFWENGLQPFLNWVAQTLYPTISPIVEGIGNLFLAAFDVAGLAINGFIGVLRALIQFLTEGFSKDWGTAWDNLASKFSGMFESLPGIANTMMNKVIDGVESMLNGVIGGLNGLTGKINGIIEKIPGDKVPSIPNVGEIHLPRLASGTVVPPRAGEFAAILGDNKRETEVVSPLSTMKQAFLDAMAQTGGMGGDINLTVNLDGRVVYQDVIKRNRMEKSRTGMNPLLA